MSKGRGEELPGPRLSCSKHPEYLECRSRHLSEGRRSLSPPVLEGTARGVGGLMWALPPCHQRDHLLHFSSDVVHRTPVLVCRGLEDQGPILTLQGSVWMFEMFTMTGLYLG